MINIDFKDIEIMPLGSSGGGGDGDGGNGNPFEVIGYSSAPSYIQEGIDYGKEILDSWDASVYNRTYDFRGHTKLIYFPRVNTSNVTIMACMFLECPHLQCVPSLYTFKVTDMGGMFQNCSSLISLDSSGWNTSKVTDMHNMFNNCPSLTSLDLSSFNTSKVTDMNHMFANCSGLTSLDLSGWNTSACTDMSYMFDNCKKLTSLDLSSFDTSKVTNMNYMFQYCSGLIRVDGYISVKSLSASTMSNSYIFGFYSISTLRKITFKDVGYHSNATQFNMTKLTNWGVNYRTVTDAKQSLIDSLITYSYDRATAGYSTFTISLATNSKAKLSGDEIAQITAKGFTLA